MYRTFVRSGATLWALLCFGSLGASAGVVGPQSRHHRHPCSKGMKLVHGRCRRVSGTTGNETKTEKKGMTKAGEFNGDLRKLPKTPQGDHNTPPVREPGGEPKVMPTPQKTPQSGSKY